MNKHANLTQLHKITLVTRIKVIFSFLVSKVTTALHTERSAFVIAKNYSECNYYHID